MLAVAQLQQESYNPVLAFKVQGCMNSKYPNLPADTFLLVIQTEFQKGLYQLYMEGACSVTLHMEPMQLLITCMVRDHFGQGKC